MTILPGSIVKSHYASSHSQVQLCRMEEFGTLCGLHARKASTTSKPRGGTLTVISDHASGAINACILTPRGGPVAERALISQKVTPHVVRLLDTPPEPQALRANAPRRRYLR